MEHWRLQRAFRRCQYCMAVESDMQSKVCVCTSIDVSALIIMYVSILCCLTTQISAYSSYTTVRKYSTRYLCSFPKAMWCVYVCTVLPSNQSFFFFQFLQSDFTHRTKEIYQSHFQAQVDHIMSTWLLHMACSVILF